MMLRHCEYVVSKCLGNIHGRLARYSTMNAPLILDWWHFVTLGLTSEIHVSLTCPHTRSLTTSSTQNLHRILSWCSLVVTQIARTGKENVWLIAGRRLEISFYEKVFIISFGCLFLCLCLYWAPNCALRSSYRSTYTIRLCYWPLDRNLSDFNYTWLIILLGTDVINRCWLCILLI